MGNETPNSNQLSLQHQTHDSIMTQFLKEFQLTHNHNSVHIKSLTHGGRLPLFQRKLQAFSQENDSHKQLIAINFQTLCKLKSTNQLQSMRAHINYYQKRIQLALDPDTDTVSSIIRLCHFSIKNQASNEIIYPESPQNKILSKSTGQNNEKNKRFSPSCGFDNIFTRGKDSKSPSITTSKSQIYTFSFLQEFNMDSLEKEIKFRRDTNQCFKEKEIWSIVYCCAKAAYKMIMNGLKEPVLSPGSIFINERCEIKVSEWEFVNYYFSFAEGSQNQEGETILVTGSEMASNSESKDILMKYYWPPEGLVEMQNILKLGELQTQLSQGNSNSQIYKEVQTEKQKIYEAKNSQVFCLGMTLLQLLTLKPYYQKSTYSEKQLTKLIEESIEIRQTIEQSMSQEIVDLLMEMLQWDPLERFRYSDIIEYIHQVFQTNQMIFGEETSRAEIQVRTVRSEMDGSQPTDSQTFRAPKLDIKRVAEVSISSNKRASTRVSAKRKSHQLNNEEISKKLYKEGTNEKLILIDEDVDMKIDRLQDSGIMWPGKGDDYVPNEEDQDVESRLPVKSVYHNKVGNIYSSISTNKNILKPLQADIEDAPQNIPEIAWIEDSELPDEDIDYEGFLQEKYQDTLLSEEKRYIQSFNINPLNDTFPQQEFSVYQYVPKNWPSVYKSNQSLESLKEQDKNDLNLSRDSLASFNLKFLNKSSENINLKKNISFDPFLNDSNSRFASPPQNVQVNNLSTIVKETQSPHLEKSINKENVFAFETNQQNSSSQIFTSENIMEMIREFTKKDTQQTPDFNAIQLTNEKLNSKSDFFKNGQAAKKLQFDDNINLVQKKFDKVYGSTLFQSSSDKLFPEIHQKAKYLPKQHQPKPVEPMVRIQFAKGTYEGSIKNNLRNGYGTFYYKQGGKYSGYWYNNKMDGHGTLYYPDGRVAYEGQWQNDSLHGKGILYNENPVKIQGKYDFRCFHQCDNEECWISYDGWFENDEKCGFGELLLSNYEKYVGEFKNDMVDGKGKFYKLDGTLFEGFWKENQLQREDE